MTHPDSGVLAEFRAGLINGRRGARISAHLATCEHCAGLCHRLAEVSVLLAAAPAPVMPDRVARRLDGVLAAEAEQRDDSERAGDPRSRGRVAGSRPNGTRPGRHWNGRLVALRVLAPAAAAVLLAAGGYGLSQIGASSSTESTAASAPSAAARSVVPRAASASRAEARPEIQVPSFQVVISRTDYRLATLRQQLEHELLLHSRKAAGPARSASASVKACVFRVTNGISPETLLLVETAHFQGQPATVIIAVSGHRQMAWVAGAACSAADEDLLATTTIPGTSAT